MQIEANQNSVLEDLKFSTWMQIETNQRKFTGGEQINQSISGWMEAVVDGVDPAPDRWEPASSFPTILQLGRGTEGCDNGSY
jgi:hypothetical protein